MQLIRQLRVAKRCQLHMPVRMRSDRHTETSQLDYIFALQVTSLPDKARRDKEEPVVAQRMEQACAVEVAAVAVVERQRDLHGAGRARPHGEAVPGKHRISRLLEMLHLCPELREGEAMHVPIASAALSHAMVDQYQQAHLWFHLMRKRPAAVHTCNCRTILSEPDRATVFV